MPSSVIRKFRYHVSQKRLEVWFVTGRHYFYYDVPADVFEAMRAAFSKGEFFNAHIRNRFRFSRRA